MTARTTKDLGKDSLTATTPTLANHMVFILDEGGEFNAPIEKVWKFYRMHGEEAHPTMSNLSVVPAGENVAIVSYDMKVGGMRINMNFRSTYYPPWGV